MGEPQQQAGLCGRPSSLAAHRASECSSPCACMCVRYLVAATAAPLPAAAATLAAAASAPPLSHLPRQTRPPLGERGCRPWRHPGTRASAPGLRMCCACVGALNGATRHPAAQRSESPPSGSWDTGQGVRCSRTNGYSGRESCVGRQRRSSTSGPPHDRPPRAPERGPHVRDLSTSIWAGRHGKPDDAADVQPAPPPRTPIHRRAICTRT